MKRTQMYKNIVVRWWKGYYNKFRANHVWWTHNQQGRFSASPNFDACSHKLPSNSENSNQTITTCSNNIYRYTLDINKYRYFSHEKKMGHVPSAYENFCTEPNLPSVEALRHDSTTIYFTKIFRRIPIIGEKLAQLVNAGLPLLDDYNYDYIGIIFIKHAIKTFGWVAALYYFYFYIFIKIYWRRVLGQGSKYLLEKTKRKKKTLYLDIHEASSDEDDLIDVELWNDFEMALTNYQSVDDHFFQDDLPENKITIGKGDKKFSLRKKGTAGNRKAKNKGKKRFSLFQAFQEETFEEEEREFNEPSFAEDDEEDEGGAAVAGGGGYDDWDYGYQQTTYNPDDF